MAGGATGAGSASRRITALVGLAVAASVGFQIATHLHWASSNGHPHDPCPHAHAVHARGIKIGATLRSQLLLPDGLDSGSAGTRKDGLDALAQAAQPTRVAVAVVGAGNKYSADCGGSGVDMVIGVLGAPTVKSFKLREGTYAADVQPTASERRLLPPASVRVYAQRVIVFESGME